MSESITTTKNPGKRIIVADDEEAVRGVIRRQLEKHGYEVIEVDDGQEVLKLLEHTAADLLITDLVMPNVEGIELIGRLHHAHPELPIIALSGNPHALPGKYLHMAGKIGARRTLEKPFASADLLQAVRDLVGS
jgi:CheY-like chemotaxis protein